MRNDVVIHKQVINESDLMEFEMPITSKIVKVKFSSGMRTLAVWYERPWINDSQPMKVRLFMFGTGARIDVINNRIEYLDTIFDGPYVWHIYIDSGWV